VQEADRPVREVTAAIYSEVGVVTETVAQVVRPVVVPQTPAAQPETTAMEQAVELVVREPVRVEEMVVPAMAETERPLVVVAEAVTTLTEEMVLQVEFQSLSMRKVPRL
jgi:hypothetical protein